jgi:hypothetical protein
MPWARLPSSFGSRLTLLDELDELCDLGDLDGLGDGPDPGAPGLDTDDTAQLPSSSPDLPSERRLELLPGR